MKKLLLITIILCLQSFPSFGSIDGKGLYCYRGPLEPYGFQFKNGKVGFFDWMVRDDKWVWEKRQTSEKYGTSTDTIYWSIVNENTKMHIIDFTLDRETLNLKVYFYPITKSDKPSERIDKCKVYSSDEFSTLIEGIRKKWQKGYDKRLKNKKI